MSGGTGQGRGDRPAGVRYASISELGSAEKIERGFLGTMLRLTSLAPDLVEAIMDGGSRSI